MGHGPKVAAQCLVLTPGGSQERVAGRDPSGMWLVTTQGFYSVVAHRTKPEHLLVRARAREDLEALRLQLPSIELHEDASADYRWRAEVHRDDWRRTVMQLVDRIDYDNFKNEVARRQGMKREAVYHRVWRELQRLQP